MICPNCKSEMRTSINKGVSVDECGTCGGLWLLKEKFDNIREKEDRFIKWLDLPLWKEDKHHKLSLSTNECPSCAKNLFAVDYHGHDITIEICPDCKGIWLDKGELEKLIGYMEDQVNEEDIEDFLKDIGHEASLMIKSGRNLVSEVRDVSAIMKLLEYRIFAKFPMLSKLASRIPLT